MDEFLLDLLATAIGIILGLPAAFWVNRQARALELRDKRLAEDEQRKSSIDTIIKSLRYNQKILKVMADHAAQGRVMRSPDLQTTTWETVRPILAPLCPDPALLQQLAHHWLRLQRLERFSEEMFARETNTLPAIEDQDLLIGSWQELYDKCASLVYHADSLAEKLEHLNASNSTRPSTPKLDSEVTDKDLLLKPPISSLQADTGHERHQER